MYILCTVGFFSDSVLTVFPIVVLWTELIIK